MKIVDCVEHLSNRLGCVLFCELSLFTDAVEELSTSCQLGYNVVFVLGTMLAYWPAPRPR